MSTTLRLFGGIFAILALATTIALVLRQVIAKGKPHSVIDNLLDRIYAWWAMAALVGLAFAFGKGGMIVLFGLLSLLALREFVTLTYTRRSDHFALALAFYLILPVQYTLIWIEWYGMYSIFIPVYGFLFLPIIVAFRADTERFFSRISQVQWALMLAVFCLSHVPALITLDIPGYGGREILLIAFLVIVVQSSDVLQYIWGKLFGRHKVAPQLSPSKTWEGLIGGVLSATALGAALWWITPFTPLQAAGIAFSINLMGFFGGLVMSAIKRDHGIKDWGHLIAGHGGVLDRLDSVLFSAPVFFHIVRFYFTP
jgi:phosphatidate cytidylyltransferase